MERKATPVRMAGFEPTSSYFRSTRNPRLFPHPELFRASSENRTRIFCMASRWVTITPWTLIPLACQWTVRESNPQSVLARHRANPLDSPYGLCFRLFAVIALRIELSATRLSAEFGQPALDYRFDHSPLSERVGQEALESSTTGLQPVALPSKLLTQNQRIP